jgi:hypothetical protein
VGVLPESTENRNVTEKIGVLHLVVATVPT